MTDTKIPAVILGLASQVNGSPIAWKEYPDRVVIVFEDGRKLTFDKAEPMPAPPADAEDAPALKSKRKEK